jgi:hypothetical protein
MMTRDSRAGVVLVRHGGATEAPSSFAAWRFRLPFPNPRIWGGRGVNGDAHPGLTLGRGGSEREIDEGDLPLRKNRGGRWAALVAVLRGKGGRRK